MSGSILGEVSVEVRADIDKLVQGFSNAKAESKKFADGMVTVNQYARNMEDAQDRAAESARRMGTQQQATAKAINAVTRATNPAITNQRLVSAALRDAEKAYMRGEISARALARAQVIAGTSAKPLIASQNLLGNTLISNARLSRILIGTIGTGLIASLGRSAIASLEATAAIGKMATQVGLTNRELQEYRFVNQQFGLSTNDTDQAFKQLKETVSDVAGGLERPKKLFDLLGVSIRDAGGQVKSQQQIYSELIDKLGQVGNKGEQTAGAMLAFGDDIGRKMGPLIDAGSAKINELREAVAATGVVLGDSEIQRADETARKLEQVKMVLAAQIAGVVTDNANSIVALAGALGQLAGAIVQFMSTNPTAALAIIGALAGRGVGGPIGMAVGAVGGAIAGSRMAQSQRDNNTDVRFRRDRMIAARDEYFKRKEAAKDTGSLIKIRRTGSPDSGGTVASAFKEWQRQIELTNKAVAGATRQIKPATEGGISLASLLAPKPPKGPKGRKGAQAPQNIFDRELLREQEENLKLLRDRSSDLAEINRIDKELIDINLAERFEQIDSMVTRKALSVAEGRTLKLEAEKNAQLEREAADRKMREEVIEREGHVRAELLDAEEAILSTALRLARTDAERTRIEAAILSLKQEQERREIDKAIALAQEAKDAKRIAELTELRRKMLERQGIETVEFATEQLTGLAKFKNELPRTVDEINEQIERIRFDLFMEKLQQAATFAEDLGSAFGRAASEIANFKNPLDVLKGLLADIAGTFTKNFIEKPVTDWATKAIGMPIAKEAFQFDQITGQQLNVWMGIATQNLNMLAAAAAAAGSGLGTANVTGIMPLTQATQDTTGAMAAQVPVLGQFGGGLMQVLSMISGGAGGGGGGLGGLLSLGMSVAGLFGGAGAGAGAMAGGANILTTPIPSFSVPGLGGYDEGGFTGGKRDRVAGLVHGEEFVVDAPNTAMARPILEQINAGRLPQLIASGALGGRGGDRHLHLGGVHVHGAKDDRSARRAGRQAAAEAQRRLAQANRAGYGSR